MAEALVTAHEPAPNGLEGIEFALTIRQPYATIIVEGPCRIANRSTAPGRGMLGKRVAIYAAGIPDTETCAMAMRLLDAAGIPQSSRMVWASRAVRRAFIGTAVVAGLTMASEDPWFVGPYGVMLADPVRLADPVPAEGRDGFWRIAR